MPEPLKRKQLLRQVRVVRPRPRYMQSGFDNPRFDIHMDPETRAKARVRPKPAAKFTTPLSLSNLRPVFELKAALGTLLVRTELNAPVIRRGREKMEPPPVPPHLGRVPRLLRSYDSPVPPLHLHLVPPPLGPAEERRLLARLGGGEGFRDPLTSYCPGPGAGARFRLRALTSLGTMGFENEEEAGTAEMLVLSLRYRNPLSGSYAPGGGADARRGFWKRVDLLIMPVYPLLE
eukprot:CAMPEP_0172079238 /NCGR_PEP_ID=MMETSP1043-20130122/18065_1 /TAXON_ID=464988 /ORGANISM="Hemiselmis andersenii, Strain CCMP441" /LENGTH=232 /DNA_ID=CAMNT_0012740405 /DNA_START=106 /DNA_END=807 /DNA_ORIENTATION=+